MKWLTVFILVCIAGISHAQTTQKFVQVIMEDSVQLEPQEFTFTVYIQNMSTYSGDSTAGDPTPQKNDHSLKALQALITRMHIDTVPFAPYHITQTDFGLRSEVTSLRFTSREKLNDFIRSARSIDGLVGTITNIKVSSSQEGEEALTRKLLGKARIRAQAMASAAGKTLGPVLQVEDLGSSALPSAGWTVYPPLSSVMDIQTGETKDKIIITKKIAVRYAW